MKRRQLLALCMEPVAITEASLRVCIAVASEDEFFAEDRARAAAEAGGIFGEPRKMTKAAGVATIPVEGPLVRKAGGMNDLCGLTSYDAIRKDYRDALADPSVRSIDFFFSTPGGQISGLFETADEIFASRGRKPMRAFVSEANSAGAVLAAAVGNVHIEQAGEMGSLGAMAGVMVPDEAGTKVIRFISSVSPLKNADPRTDEGRAAMQERVDQLGQLLVEKVATYRGVSIETVKNDFGKGAVLTGARAVTARLADKVGYINFDKGTQMNISRMAAAVGLDDSATEDQIAERAQALAAFERQALAATAAKDGAEAHGVMVAAMESHRAAPALRDRVAQLEANDIRRELRAALEPVALGQIRTAVVDMVSAADEAKGAAIKAALDALPEKFEQGVSERDAVLAAVCSVDIGPGALRAVQSYAKHAPRASVPHREPVRDPKAEAEHDAQLNERSGKIKAAADSARAQYGVTVK